VRAANDGLVVYADNGVRGFGNLLVLLHADGTATFYAHCQAIYAAPGQLVRRGQVVGEVGATGLPVVPHLHFEWRRNGVPRDPLRRLVERPDAREVRPDADTPFAPPPPNVVAPVVTTVVPAPRAE
jgi:murein DD-endopeptidase MepM/ murein hydrolase activator NlpD